MLSKWLLVSAVFALGACANQAPEPPPGPRDADLAAISTAFKGIVSDQVSKGELGASKGNYLEAMLERTIRREEANRRDANLVGAQRTRLKEAPIVGIGNGLAVPSTQPPPARTCFLVNERTNGAKQTCSYNCVTLTLTKETGAKQCPITSQ